MINFKEMPLQSRVWIYQSIREFSKNEITLLKTKGEDFISEWTSHGKKMSACIEIFYNRFIIVCVDEKTTSASGCGIDKSVKFIQKLEKEFKTSLFDRLSIAFRKKSVAFSLKEEIRVCGMHEIKKLITFSERHKGITVFNNLVNTKEELEKNWEVPFEKSWQYEKLKQ
jgi:hypothetical protein